VTVMGGPHVTFNAHETIESYPELDLICLGEGDETIVELARAWERGCKWRKIHGLVFRRGQEILTTSWREKQVDVNSLPLPARHLLPLRRYRALGMPVSMTSSRGCPFRCIFCVGRKMVGPRVRFRDPLAVADEFELLSAMNFFQINMADDLFAANKEHCIEVCDEIIRRGLKAKWSSFARVDTISREVLERMKQAGCATVSFGVESANAGILETIKKGITTEQVIEAVRMCRDAGIAPHASFILGLPGETPDTLKETIDFADRIGQLGAFYGFHLLAPFPGTEVCDESDRLGLKILTRDWSEYHANRAVVETAEVGREMLDRVVMDWEARLENYFLQIRKRMENGSATAAESGQVIGLERIMVAYELMMGNLIEERGFWDEETGPVSDSEALRSLAGRVENALAYNSDTILDALDFAKENGTLKCFRENGQIRWRWMDYL